MGKNLIITGADFSENALDNVKEWITILEGTWTAASNGQHTLKQDLDIVIPSGTNTRVTAVVTAEIESGATTTRKISVSPIDSDGTTHNNYWNDNSSWSCPLDGTPATYTKELVTDIDIVGLDSYFQKAGSSLSFKLEAYM